MSHEGRQNIDPRLLAIIDEAERKTGIFVSSFKNGDVVEITTKNHVYRFEMKDSEGRALMTSNNPDYLGPEEAVIVGSSLTGTGTMVKMGLIAPDYRLWIGNILLSRTQSVKVNGRTINFAPKYTLN